MNRRWSKERANAWYKQQPWLVGCNFIPSTAINQLEMWQAETFDPEMIERELGWAADLGMNTVRVYLHDRPLLCTEYLARDKGSLFETHLPIFKATNVGCYNWGLVSGKTQTIYSWKDRGGRAEPNPWYHDLLWSDGRPYRASEIALMQRLTGAAQVQPRSDHARLTYP